MRRDLKEALNPIHEPGKYALGLMSPTDCLNEKRIWKDPRFLLCINCSVLLRIPERKEKGEQDFSAISGLIDGGMIKSNYFNPNPES